MKTLMVCLLLACGAEAQSLIRQAPAKALGRTNPFAGRALAERAGAKLFARECSACHGVGGKNAPPLAQREVYEAALGALFWVLKNGSVWRGMPSFAHLPEPQRWQIIAYLQETSYIK